MSSSTSGGISDGKESSALQAAQTRKEISRHRDRAVLPALEAVADELEMRARTGDLAQELHGMKAGALLGQMTRIITAIKDAAPQIMINNPAPTTEETWLKANSAAGMTDTERAKRRKEAEVVDAEVIKNK